MPRLLFPGLLLLTGAALAQTPTQGLQLPSVTTTQMNALANPSVGQLLYNTTANSFYGYKPAPSTTTLTQNQSNTSATNFGQSFTASASGTLTSVTVYLLPGPGYEGTPTLSLQLYQGAGVSGAPTQSVNQQVRLRNTGSTPITFSVSPGLAVTAGQQYSFSVTGCGPCARAACQNTNVYSGGQVYINQAASTGDLQFQLQFQVLTPQWVPLN